MRIITVTNQKGGVGKTTTAVNVAFGLAMEGRRTLLVDSDPQANATTALIGTEILESTLYDLFVSDIDLNAIIIRTRQKNLDLLPSEIRLAGVESELLRKDNGQTILNRKFRKAKLKRYDYIIIDTPPSLGLLTVNALAASTEVIIPVSASFFAIKGLDQLERVLELVRDRLEL